MREIDVLTGLIICGHYLTKRWRRGLVVLQLKCLCVTVNPMLTVSSLARVSNGILFHLPAFQYALIFKNVFALSSVIFLFG